MRTFANIKKITIKRTPKKEGEKFYHISQDILKSAMQNIKKVSALKLYLYLSRNSNNVVWDYVKEQFIDWSNLSTNVPNDAIKELVELGYLLPIDGSKTKYTFYDSLELAEQYKEKQIKEEQELKIKENIKKDTIEPFVF